MKCTKRQYFGQIICIRKRRRCKQEKVNTSCQSQQTCQSQPACQSQQTCQSQSQQTCSSQQTCPSQPSCDVTPKMITISSPSFREKIII